MFEARDLACTRGDRRLFAEVNFLLGAGDVLHVAGRNGSGKTSLLRILSGLATPQEGTVLWNGADIRTLREEFARELLYIGHLNGIKDDLTGVENLRIGSELEGRRAADEEIHTAFRCMGLEGCEDIPSRFLSQGQKRRVALCRLLLGERSLWILDEPYTALDVAAIDVVRDALHDHLARGGMVILTTHQDVELKAGTRRLQLS